MVLISDILDILDMLSLYVWIWFVVGMGKEAVISEQEVFGRDMNSPDDALSMRGMVATSIGSAFDMTSVLRILSTSVDLSDDL